MAVSLFDVKGGRDVAPKARGRGQHKISFMRIKIKI
jgi:hypothetical protein